MLGRLQHSADFQRVLATPIRSRSAHFAVHHLQSEPKASGRAGIHVVSTELSTADAPGCPAPVDDLPDRQWLGTVVPKRHARRSVTRNLLRRQIRAVMERHAAALPPGLWLVRLRSPFAKEQFPSAASDALRVVAREELDQLLQRAAAPGRR
jgi:ribonuclease P protein component